jgi:glycosyltransferase involved in cell wall biosynthesis
MNILIIHEVDWLKKVTYEIHHLSELFSLYGHNVSAIDVPDPGLFSINKKNYQTLFNYHRVYDKSCVTLFRTPVIPIKGLNRISAYFTSYNFIKNILKKQKIDVVLLYSVITNAKATIKACKELNIPIIHRTFDIIHDLIRENYLRKRVLSIEKSVYPQFDKVITNTPFMENWAKEMGSISVSIIPQGVDPCIMRSLSPDKKLQNELGIQEKDQVIMYLGSIESFSGLDIFIKEIPCILKKIPNFKLLIVGGGSHLDSIRQQSKKIGIDNKIIFTGFKPYFDVPRYCSLAKLCINTFKINEMTDKLSPVKVFDLQACGKPNLVTPLQGLLYDFPEKQCGLIYAQLEDFPDKIISLLQDEEKLKLKGQLGLKFIQENFTWKKAAEKWINEFESITGNFKG